MKERPILFSGPMVRAILKGRKSQTRRVVKPQPDAVETYNFSSGPRAGQSYSCLRCYDPPARFKPCASGWSVDCPGPFKIPGAPGDRLWVRETWQALTDFGHGHRIATKEELAARSAEIRYRATDETGWIPELPWRPSIFMPRWACRIVLEITDVRVERLRDISEADAAAEGVNPVRYADGDGGSVDHTAGAHRKAFERLWGDINGFDSWLSNPWVWVVEFRNDELTERHE